MIFTANREPQVHHICIRSHAHRFVTSTLLYKSHAGPGDMGGLLIQGEGIRHARGTVRLRGGAVVGKVVGEVVCKVVGEVVGKVVGEIVGDVVGTVVGEVVGKNSFQRKLVFHQLYLQHLLHLFHLLHQLYHNQNHKKKQQQL